MLGGAVLAVLVWLLIRLQRGGSPSTSRAGRSGGARRQRGGTRRGSSAPETAGILGFSLTQILIIGIAVLTAVLVGLVLGGGP